MEEKTALWKLFGTETETGRMLRTIYAEPRISSPVVYPKCKISHKNSTVQSSPILPKSAIKYPRFNKSSSPSKICKDVLSRRKPLSEIKKDLESIRFSLSEKPIHKLTDRNEMKSHLQQIFQFGSPKLIDQSAIDPPTASNVSRLLENIV